MIQGTSNENTGPAPIKCVDRLTHPVYYSLSILSLRSLNSATVHNIVYFSNSICDKYHPRKNDKKVTSANRTIVWDKRLLQ